MQRGWLHADARLLGPARRPLRALTRVRLRSTQALFGWGGGGRESKVCAALLLPWRANMSGRCVRAPAPGHLPAAHCTKKPLEYIRSCIAASPVTSQ